MLSSHLSIDKEISKCVAFLKFYNLINLILFQDDPKIVEQAVHDAIDAGYRHFDCAYIYQNEKEIGKVLREKIAKGIVKREDLFITTKVHSHYLLV